MKRMPLLLTALLVVVMAGCTTAGLYWGPDVQVRLYNVPSTQGTLVTVVNSTSHPMELVANGREWGLLPPHGRKTIVFRRLYVNWYSGGGQEMLLARVRYRGQVVTLSHQVYASNWDRRAEVWEITERMVEWKFRQMSPY
jgi:hypothetical protein